MREPVTSNDPIERLRSWRTKPAPDLSMAFLREQFKRDVERPHKQMGSLVELWARLVPEAIQSHARLEGFSRGVLRVAVDSSVQLYELDRLLRSGLQQRLIAEHKGPLRRVQLRVDDSWARDGRRHNRRAPGPPAEPSPPRGAARRSRQ